MPKFRIVTPAGPSFSNSGGGLQLRDGGARGARRRDLRVPGDEAGFIAAAKGADAVYAKGMKFTRAMIEALDKCKLIALGTVGVDYVDVAAATEKGIPVTNCPDTFIEEVADHAMMLLLATHRRAIEQDRMVREGRWAEGRPQLLKVPRLMGQTLGFIAFGRVARAVAERAKPFGLRMMAFDPVPRRARHLRPRRRAGEPAGGAEPRPISSPCTLPATPEAVGFLKEQHFRQMKKNAIFINTGRGPTVDESALIKALQEKWIAGAGLDVLAGGAGEARQPAAEDAARHPVAARRLGLGPLRSGAPAPRRPGAGAGADRALADVVRQPVGAAGKRPAALAAGVDGARPELVAQARASRGSPPPCGQGRRGCAATQGRPGSTEAADQMNSFPCRFTPALTPPRAPAGTTVTTTGTSTRARPARG